MPELRSESSPELRSESSPSNRRGMRRSFSYTELNKKGGELRDAILSERHKVLIMARILLAVPGPAFLVFSAIQQFRTNVFTSAWGLSASFTELKTGQNFAVYVLLITGPLWILSLLIANIEKKPPGSLQEWLEAYRDNRVNEKSFTKSTYQALQKGRARCRRQNGRPRRARQRMSPEEGRRRRKKEDGRKRRKKAEGVHTNAAAQ